WAPRRAGRAERRLADNLLDFVGCAGASERPAEDLPHVEKRLVEIARALAQRPSVLLLDEPAAGLGERDKERLAALLRRIAATGVAVVLVEHDMSLVMELSDRVVVLDAGRCIAVGSPAAVQSDPVVIKAYLGDSAFRPQPRVAPLPPSARPALTVAGLGANGAGKSTMMRALSGLLRPVQGSIRLGAEEINVAAAHRIARAGLV